MQGVAYGGGREQSSGRSGRLDKSAIWPFK